MTTSSTDADTLLELDRDGVDTMADQPLAKQKQEARKKGYAALGSAATTALFTAMIHPGFLIPGAPITLWLAYRWFKYRAKWGIKF